MGEPEHGPVPDLSTLRAQFLALIAAYSEERWAAGWSRGVEQYVRSQGGVWLAMAVACDGWPVGYQAEEGWAPLTEAERSRWAEMVPPGP